MSKNLQVQMVGGQGKILRESGEMVCTGTYTYNLILRDRSDEQPSISGTFMISGVAYKKLMEILTTLSSNPYWVLENNDGKKYDIGIFETPIPDFFALTLECKFSVSIIESAGH